MRILFLAPQPFFQERGTPIAVRLALEVLAARGKDSIDLLTYHEGEEVSIPGVTLHRIKAPRWLSGIGPGLSFKKLLCDIFFFFSALSLVIRARRDPYRIVHAVEEGVFIALLIKLIWRIPYIYDMDSSLALQVTEKWAILKPLHPILAWMERLAVTHSMTVVPVCDALAVIARNHGSTETHVLSDISLLKRGAQNAGICELRAEAEVPPDHQVVLYIGNLERYQGIDLLLRSFAKAASKFERATVVIIGGRPEHIDAYEAMAHGLGIASRVRFLGPRPVSTLDQYLKQADILVSPRVKGNNTPMKIYSYLHSGKVIVATALPTHTQVMDSSVAMLAEPTADAYSEALLTVLASAELRAQLGSAAERLAEERYTFENFSRTLCSIYERINGRMAV